MACQQRGFAEMIQREIRLRGVIEVKKVDFARRIQRDLRPATRALRCRIALVNPHFAHGDIDGIEAAGRPIGQGHTDDSGRSCSLIAAIRAGRHKSEHQQCET
jgi:hypothetical protein